ncbi:MAG: hypothetical protein WC208_08455 [Gallionella sp.]|jgi:hypothetical protein
MDEMLEEKPTREEVEEALETLQRNQEKMIKNAVKELKKRLKI